MSVQNIIEAALQKARTTAGGTEKSASAPPQTDLIKVAHQLADANEFIALSAADDGTPDGQIRRSVVEQFFKGADTTAIKGPAQSEAPTGTQAMAPQSGAKKILPTGKASGNSPAESEAPTGTQATLDQTGTKKAGAEPMTLLDMLTKSADTSTIPGPQQSVSGQNVEAPPAKNENTNIDLVRSAEGIVNATKRDAKLPTRARLKQLFAHAGDTGASSAAAHAAFPMAASKGGLKVAEAEKDPDGEGAHGRRVGVGAAIGAGLNGAVSGAATHSLGGAALGAALGAGHGALAGHFYHRGRVKGYQEAKEQPLTHRGSLTAGNALGGLLLHAPSGIANMIGRGQGIERAERESMAAKKASLYDYAKLAEAASDGQLGEEAQAILRFAEELKL